MSRRASKVTEKQSLYIEGVLTGKTKTRAAKDAGFRDSEQVDMSATVKRELAKAREAMTDLTKITRLVTIDGILDGIALARMQGDAGNVIKGWTEIAKIQGHYAPEVKTINVNMNQQRLLNKFESLSDEELTAIMNGQAIDVDAKEIPGTTH
jgi:phage terminase small subunit